MSFDWLNVPGLNLGSGDQAEKKQSNGLGPPSVSFDFGANAAAQYDSNFWDKGSRSQSDTSLSYRSNHANARTSSAIKKVDSPQKGDPHTDVRKTSEGEGDVYTETHEDMQVPLSLSQGQLTHEEIRTYLRWYNYICLRTHGKLVRLNDVFRFLVNFNLSQQIKDRIIEIFRSCKNALNIGQFFAVLRLISRAIIQGTLPLRRMILEKAPVPKPRPILNNENHQEVYEEVEEDDDNTTRAGDGKVDFDSFASLLLTGRAIKKRVRRRIKNSTLKSKKVRFSEHITFQDPPNLNQDLSNNNGAKKQINIEENRDQNASNDGPLDLTLPMDQLLKRLYKGRQNSGLVSSLPSEQQETEEEKKVLEDMKDSLSHFKQIQTVDSASLPMSSMLSQNGNVQPKSNANSNTVPQQVPLEPLKPTATGSANHLVREEYNNGILPNNGVAQTGLQPLKPTATGSANYLMRSQMEQPQPYEPTNTADTVVNPGGLQPLKPTATGSANYLMKQHLSPSMFQTQFTNQPSSPQPTGQFMNSPNIIVSQNNQQQQPYQGIGSNKSNAESSNISPQHTYSNNIRINDGNIMPMPKVEVSSAHFAQNTFPHHQQSHLISPQNTVSQYQQSHLVTSQNNFAQNQATMISPQNTYQNNQPTMISPQHTYSNNQQQTSHIPPPPPPRNQQQQPTAVSPLQQSYPNIPEQNNLLPNQNAYTNSPSIQSPNFLSPQTAANSYFQSLLSTSSSPNPTPPNASISNGHNTNVGDSINSFQSNMTGSNPSMNISQSHQTYNGNYSAINHQQQQPQSQQIYGGQLPQMQQQHPGQPQLNNSNIQNQLNKPNYGTLGQQVQQQQQQQQQQQFPFNADVNRSNSSDILGNLQSLQQQVDALQIQYNRRP